jgi:hypothetical protein
VRLSVVEIARSAAASSAAAVCALSGEATAKAAHADERADAAVAHRADRGHHVGAARGGAKSNRA